MYEEGDQIVPYQDASVLAVKLAQNGTRKIYPGFYVIGLSVHSTGPGVALLIREACQHSPCFSASVRCTLLRSSRPRASSPIRGLAYTS